MKRYLLIYFALFLALVTISSCTEKELIMPEVQSQDNLISLGTRPSLRPDSVKVHPGFYYTVEVVYPEVQPDRAVSSTITYTDADGVTQVIEVTDFGEIIAIDNIAEGETSFVIVYYTADGKPSASVTHRVTPYRAVTDYVYEKISGKGEFGNAYIVWENITTKEVQVEVKYEDQGQLKTISKLSSALRDTIVVPDLANVDYLFDVQVKDLERGYVSDVQQLTINPGMSVQGYALSTLTIDPGFGRAFLTWENPAETCLVLRLSYEVDGQAKSVEYTSTAADGSYVLTNLPEGALNVIATFTNTQTNETTGQKTLAVTVNQGVKETVSQTFTLSSYGGGLGLLRGTNLTTVPVTMAISYENTSGQTVNTELVLEANATMQQYITLKDVKENAIISVNYTDDIGTINKSYSSSIRTVINDDWYAQSVKNTWTAAASSQRLGHSNPPNPNFLPQNVLDGVIENANLIWANEYTDNRVDSLGKRGNQVPHWLKIDMKEPRLLTAFSYVLGQDNFRPGLSYIECSNDGIEWTKVAEYNDTNNWSSAQARWQRIDIAFDHPIVARYVRMYITTILGSTTVVRVSEVHLKGENAY